MAERTPAPMPGPESSEATQPGDRLLAPGALERVDEMAFRELA
jgi:hypothetical protein